MSAATNFAENKIADGLFRTTTLARPATWHIALFTAAPNDTGGGTEVTGGSYARVGLTPSDTNWFGTHGTTSGASSGTGGVISNAVLVQFATPTADWGTIVSAGLFDASTGGNLWFQGALLTPRLVQDIDPAGPVFASGQLIFIVA